MDGWMVGCILSSIRWMDGWMVEWFVYEGNLKFTPYTPSSNLLNSLHSAHPSTISSKEFSSV